MARFVVKRALSLLHDLILLIHCVKLIWEEFVVKRAPFFILKFSKIIIDKILQICFIYPHKFIKKIFLYWFCTKS